MHFRIRCLRFAVWGLGLVSLLGVASGCRGGDGGSGSGSGGGSSGNVTSFAADWPDDLDVVYSTDEVDAVGDQILMPPEMAGPPYTNLVVFESVDVSRIRLGVEGDFLYLRVDYLGVIPSEVVHILPDGEIEEQWVRNMGMNISVNSDGSLATGGGGEGVDGIDIYFSISFDFGGPGGGWSLYANYDMPDGDLHVFNGQILGEPGDGGPGFDYAIARFDVSDLGPNFFPHGATVDAGGWSEAESFDQNGDLLYHHFAFDQLPSFNWSIPAAD